MKNINKKTILGIIAIIIVLAIGIFSYIQTNKKPVTKPLPPNDTTTNIENDVSFIKDRTNNIDTGINTEVKTINDEINKL